MKLSKILKRKIDFYKLLEEHADYIIASVDALDLYIKTVEPQYADRVKLLEKQADEKRWELVQALNKTFITPYDREDIYLLSKALDDILDYFKTTVNEMEIYQIEPSSELADFIGLLQNGSRNICEAVFQLKRPEESMASAMRAKKSENQVEALYRKSIAELLESDDVKHIIKMRELYRHLSNCADKIDQAADSVCHILMKEVS